jgi:acyl transferase domain-containing protein/ubiquinone/menaquinone biosynthesis C-methylase UbiE/acyl carrier protein
MAENTQNSTAKQALAAIQQLQGRIRELENAGSEPIAVVGLGCRFPGGIHGPDEFWDALMKGVDGIVEIPAERWNVDEFYDPEMDVPGKMYTRYGGFIRDIDQFDARFFGISPREAVMMDPQQRLLLQTVWESFEYGGFDLNELYGSKTGVYVGISNFEYGAKGIWPADKKKITSYSGTGGSLGVTAGRLSYVYGFTGPSMIVDTACSSSLVTTHLAIQALRNGECDMAVSAGVNLIMGPETHIYFCQGHMLAPDGHCKTFSSDANGYARGEGVGAIVLKRLSDAEKDGDTIFGVLLGSAVNQDGPSGGLTVPNGPSQEAVIKSALKNAHIKPVDVGYIEAHGTGTPLGDPIEISALSRVFGKDRDVKQNPLQVASVKTNLGHLESAAGIAGLIKTILSTAKGVLPSHQNYQAPNPHIEWASFPGNVVLGQSEWKSEKRIGGVSSFSFSGTNAHVLVSNYVPKNGAKKPVGGGLSSENWPKQRVLTLSGHSEQHLKALSNAYATYLEGNPSVEWNQFCTSAALGKTHQGKRATIIAADSKEAVQMLKSGDFDIRTRKPATPRIAFQYTGQGAQFPGMGKDLYEQIPTFKAAIDECAEICKSFLDVNLTDVMFNDSDEGSELIHNTRYTQPVLFAFEYAYTKMLNEFGIHPDVLIGHSLGEFVAATISGIFRLEDALKIVSERGRLMVEKGQPGAMVSISLSADTVASIIARNEFSKRVDIAGINTFEQVTVAGDAGAIDNLCDVLESMGADFKRLSISHAFHCHLAEPMADAFRQVLESVSYGKPTIDLVSNVRGMNVQAMVTPGYWSTHLRESVDYLGGVDRLIDEGVDVIIEIGPKPILTAFGKVISEQKQYKSMPVWISCSKKQVTPWIQLLHILSTLYELGFDEPVKRLYQGSSRYPVHIPFTPFLTESFWIEAENVTVSVAGSQAHPLLGELLDSPAIDKNTSIFRTIIGPDTIGFLAHHKVGGHIVLPAAAHVEMMYSAARRISKSPVSLSDFEIQSALILDEFEPNTIQVVLRSNKSGQFEIQLFSKPGNHSDWQLHSSSWTTEVRGASMSKMDLSEVLKTHSNQVSVQEYYDMTHALGIEHGTKFQAVEALFTHDQDTIGRLVLPQPNHPGNRGFTLHPALLDAAFQVSSYALKDHKSPFLPVGAESIRVFKELPSTMYCVSKFVGKLDVSHTDMVEFDLTLIDDHGFVLAEVEKLRFQKVSMSMFEAAFAKVDEWMFDITWKNNPVDYPLASEFDIPDFGSGELAKALTELSDSCAFYGELFQKFDSIISESIQVTFTKLGWIPAVGEISTVDELTEKLGISATFSALFNRCIEMLVEDGILSVSNNEISVLRAFSTSNTGFSPDFIKNFPQAKPEISLLNRCLDNLGDVLTGKTDPIQLLFPPDVESSAASLYKNSVGSAAINRLLAKTVEEFVSNVPKFKKLRVLEIGAGTGGTTTHVLPVLPKDRTEYWYTDISRHFLNLGKQRFSEDFPFMEFGLFDVERNESEIPDGQFDLIIAANVLHATNDISRVMQHCKSRLKPGGVVVMLEAAPKQHWLDMTFGMTDGWWRFRNSDPLRADYPLLDIDSWKHVLTHTGFESISMAGESNPVVTKALKQQVIIAKAPVTADVILSKSVLITSYRESDLSSFRNSDLESESIRVSEFERVSDELKEHQTDAVVLFVKPEVVDETNCLTTQHSIFAHLQSLVKSMVDSGIGSVPRLWICAPNAFSNGTSDNVSSNWSLSGIIRSIRSEYPELNATLIDPGTDSVDDIRSILKHEIHDASSEDIIRYQDGVRYVQRLSPQQLDRPEPLHLSESGSYLITGGFGPLGLLTSTYLAEKGAKHVVLMGRNLPTTERIAGIREKLLSLGATLHTIQGDVSNPTDVKAIFSNKDYPSIKGIIHSAGTLSDRTFENISPAELDNVMLTKVMGALLLHGSSANLELDFFITYSSIGALFGPTGQSNYAAANAWMDQLMHHRKSAGLPGLSINWGAWSGESLASRNTGSVKSVLLNSILEINPDQGKATFDRLFSTTGQKVVVPFNHSSVHESLKSMSFLGEIFSSAEDYSSDPSTGSDSTSYSQLSGIELENEIVRKVCVLTAKVLGSTPEKIDPTLGFFDLGMDSLTSVELRNALQQEFSLSLPTTLIFKYPSIESLSEYLVTELSESVMPSQPENVSKTEATAEKDIQELSEDELSALIDDAFNDVLGDKE